MGLICYISRPLNVADEGLDTFAEQLLRTKHLLSIQAITGTVFAAQGNLEVSEKEVSEKRGASSVVTGTVSTAPRCASFDSGRRS
jgi:hypothetical protein